MSAALTILALACGMQFVCIVRDGIRGAISTWRSRMPRPTGIVYVPKHANDLPGF